MSLVHNGLIRRGLAALAAGAVIFGVSACSGAGAGGSTDASGTVSLIVGAKDSDSQLTPLFVAVDKGFFSDEGLDVSLQAVNGGIGALTAALSSNAINVMVGSAADTATYVAEGALQAKIFGQLANSGYNFVVSSDINSVADLKGKAIAVSGVPGLDYLMIRLILASGGLSENDVTFITAGNPTNRQAALVAGQVAAYAGPKTQQSTDEQIGKILDVDVDTFTPNAVYVANDSWFEGESLSTLQHFIAAMNKATAWVRSNEAESVQICVQHSGYTQEACQTAYDGFTDESLTTEFTWSSSQAIDMDGVGRALELQAMVTPEVANITVDDIVDTSLTTN